MPLMASKLMFLAHCWQKSNAHTQKVGNDRMLSLKSCCRHLRHWSFYHIVMLVLKAKHLSDYYWVCSKNFPKQRKPEAECKHVSFCVCACLAGFSECFGIHLHEDKRKELRKLKKNQARQNHGKNFLTQNYYWQSWKQLKTTFIFQLLSIKHHLDNSAS